MTAPAWIGLDVGTTSSKASAYGIDGTLLAATRTATPWQASPQGVQIPADDLLNGALDALNRLAELLDDQNDAGVTVAGIGITSMGETGVLVDGHDRPVAPAIAWHDGRDQVEVAELARDIGAAEFGARAGKPLRGQFSLTKHRWLVRHQQASVAVRRFNVAEWVARGLGAEPACDRTLACRTGWYDIAADDWWDEALLWSGATRGLMPDVVDPGEPIGRVTTPVHARLSGAVVTLAGHDHQAAALGVGAVLPGDELDSCGTAEALVRTVRPDLTEAHRATLAAGGITTDLSIRREHWSLLGGTEGGLAMQRALDLLGVTRAELPALDMRALAAPFGRVRVAGLGGPGLNAGGPGVYVGGIADGVDPGEVWRAVVEAATAQARELHDAMTAIAGVHHRLVATGGWCHSAMVLSAKRAAFGSVRVAEVAEAGTLGAAVLAARATGDLGPEDRLGPDPCGTDAAAADTLGRPDAAAAT